MHVIFWMNYFFVKKLYTLLGTNISPTKALLKMIFLSPSGICYSSREGKLQTWTWHKLNALMPLKFFFGLIVFLSTVSISVKKTVPLDSRPLSRVGLMVWIPSAGHRTVRESRILRTYLDPYRGFSTVRPRLKKNKKTSKHAVFSGPICFFVRRICGVVACNAKNWQKLRKSLSLKLWSKIFDLSQAEGKQSVKKKSVLLSAL